MAVQDLRFQSMSDIHIKLKSNDSPQLPTPLDFDEFIPYWLKEMQNPVPVIVQKVAPVSANKVQKENIKRQTSSMTRSKQVHFSTKASQPPSSHSSTTPSAFNNSFDPESDRALRITTYYDSEGNLTEISFTEHPVVPIHCQVLKAIAICLPFHPMLNKISIRREKLDCGIVYEISKLLPFSKLTEICLDHCHVLQGNFYILLDQQTTLKCLSLSDCNIDDLVCKEIADRIEDIRPASLNLRVLNLSFNSITDVGAEALGRALRTNRHLVYLNLCNNSISSVGAAHILEPLTEFPFTIDEQLKYKDKRYYYIKKKLENAEACLNETQVNGVDDHESQSVDSQSSKKRETKSTKSGLYRKKPISSSEIAMGASVLDSIDEMALDIAAQSNDAFHPANMFRRDGSLFSVGNFVLCCLNLGYNRLDFSFLESLGDVLSYQKQNKRRMRGLLRVVIEGNELPVSSSHYDLIRMYLHESVKNFVPSSLVKTRRHGTQTRERRRSKENR